jgi:hypothetical protein
MSHSFKKPEYPLRKRTTDHQPQAPFIDLTSPQPARTLTTHYPCNLTTFNFSPEILLQIFIHYFHHLFNIWFRDWSNPVMALTLYNIEYRPDLDALLCSTAAHARHVVSEAFWTVLGQRAPIRLERRHNLTIEKPWAFPRKPATKFIKTLQLVLHFRDKDGVRERIWVRGKQVDSHSFLPGRQGDMSFLKRVMAGEYGFEGLEECVVYLHDRYKEMGEGARSTIKEDISERFLLGLKTLGRLRVCRLTNLVTEAKDSWSHIEGKMATVWEKMDDGSVTMKDVTNRDK